MKTIEYKEGMKLALLVRDRGGFDGFSVYVNGNINGSSVMDQGPHRYEIPRPANKEVVVVQFGGNDGGDSAIFDLSGAAPKRVGEQQGRTHAYLIQPV